MRRTLIALLVVATTAASAETAQAQADPDDFTPEGYEFCGWRDFDNGGWTYDQPEPGAYLLAFARGMTCTAARRNITRLRYTQLPPYRPVRLGYRCRTLDNDHEYTDVRCVRRGGTRAFRFQTGA
jgi:hypothetical protein